MFQATLETGGQGSTWCIGLPVLGHESGQLVDHDMTAHLYGPSLPVKP